MEHHPLIPFPTARLEQTRFDSFRFDAELEDWAWAMRLEEELDYDLFARDAVAMRRQRLVGRVRLVALIALVASIAVVIRVGVRYGVGLGLLGAWAMPVVVLAVVLSAEKLFLRFSR